LQSCSEVNLAIFVSLNNNIARIPNNCLFETLNIDGILRYIFYVKLDMDEELDLKIIKIVSDILIAQELSIINLNKNNINDFNNIINNLYEFSNIKESIREFRTCSDKFTNDLIHSLNNVELNIKNSINKIHESIKVEFYKYYEITIFNEIEYVEPVENKYENDKFIIDEINFNNLRKLFNFNLNTSDHLNMMIQIKYMKNSYIAYSLSLNKKEIEIPYEISCNIMNTKSRYTIYVNDINKYIIYLNHIKNKFNNFNKLSITKINYEDKSITITI
jgi:hypothetical protein